MFLSSHDGVTFRGKGFTNIQSLAEPAFNTEPCGCILEISVYRATPYVLPSNHTNEMKSFIMFPKVVDIVRLTTNLKKITAVVTLNVFWQVSCHRQ